MSSFKRYFLIAVATLLLDLSVFVVFYSSGLSIFQAAMISRLIASVFNLSFNKYYVFKSPSSSPSPYEIITYFFLSFSTALISAAVITALGLLSVLFVSSAKFLIDSFIFVFNY